MNQIHFPVVKSTTCTQIIDCQTEKVITANKSTLIRQNSRRRRQDDKEEEEENWESKKWRRKREEEQEEKKRIMLDQFWQQSPMHNILA